MKVVMVAGGFDPIHPGHIRYLEEALKLGDHLLVVLTRDDQLVRKKQFCFMPYDDRKFILQWGLKGQSFEIVPNIDTSLLCADSIRHYKPNVFAKGGDYSPDNMPPAELDACREVGCEIIYGVGGYEKTTSSSNYVKKAMAHLLSHENGVCYI